MSAVGAGAVAAAMQALLLAFLLSLVGLLSMRGASRTLGRMVERRPTRGLRAARLAARIGFGVSTLATVLCGGLLVAIVALW
ncbi:hypothetical protein [Paraliomyxa miuraensis]|uniref:hypothetical protein n=1 Tax=Paraliomyxa miuraensis TaxID=376150 RepID=UPI00225BF5E0|nr:hypothetical protein [Paraliomyxa miuraensis]MCX4242888.1 hypothetical protein [Paraliomyxa miuraensis]